MITARPIFSCTCGNQDAERATLPFVLANSALRPSTHHAAPVPGIVYAAWARSSVAERGTFNPCVVGSNPTGLTTIHARTGQDNRPGLSFGRCTPGVRLTGWQTRPGSRSCGRLSARPLPG